MKASSKRPLKSAVWPAVCNIALLCALLESGRAGAAAPDSGDASVAAATERAVVLPEPIGDPLEPINRGLWIVNRKLMSGVIQPTSKAYRVMVPKPLRTGIRNAGRNIGYPRRVLNNLFQENWAGARDETYRFLCNSIFGIGGLFDVGTRWKIPESEADFGQSLGLWGWRPHFYLMLPIAGPSNERDALGGIVDSLVNPLTYFPPYSYITYGITYNNLSETVDEYVRASKMDFDPYYVLRYAWTLRRENRGVELSFEGEQDAPSLETLQSVFFTFQDRRFPEYGLTRRVAIPATGKKLPLTYWLQPKSAPLVYIVPGLGSHRLSSGALALDEVL
jgi:phospholipid-binding lipoprotein MlaA